MEEINFELCTIFFIYSPKIGQNHLATFSILPSFYFYKYNTCFGILKYFPKDQAYYVKSSIWRDFFTVFEKLGWPSMFICSGGNLVLFWREKDALSPIGGVGNPFCQTDRAQTLIVLDTTHKRARETAKSNIRARGKTGNTWICCMPHNHLHHHYHN